MLHDRFLRPKDKAAAPLFAMFEATFAEQFPEELARLTAVVRERQEAHREEPEPELPTPDEAKRLATAIS
jgi:hypothetical protein